MRFQSPSLTTCALHHALTKHCGSTRRVQWLALTYPDAPCYGRDYRLELYSDLPRLPSAVPDLPDFSSDPCRITTASAAHLRGASPTLSGRPYVGFSPIRHIQGCSGRPESRFRVAQHQSRFDIGWSRKRESHPLALHVCRASAITRTRLRQCPRTRLATVEAGFPAGVDPGGARIGVTVCACGGWRPPHSDPPGVCARWLAPWLRDVRS